MFTGLISDVGTVVSRDGGVFTVRSAYDPASIALGASIAFDGCCLTIVEATAEDAGALLRVDVSNETLSRTALGDWTTGRRVNLERSLRAGDELGGHIVTGHVDGVAQLVEVKADGNATRMTFEAPVDLGGFIAEKGSVSLNGTSLTVNEVDGARFGCALIPHTCSVTTWGDVTTGDRINIEVDVLARYVARHSAYTTSTEL
ncbi:MAG: riboflavin synthase [Pseudomonadota bacterium]